MCEDLAVLSVLCIGVWMHSDRLSTVTKEKQKTNTTPMATLTELLASS